MIRPWFLLSRVAATLLTGGASSHTLGQDQLTQGWILCVFNFFPHAFISPRSFGGDSNPIVCVDDTSIQQIFPLICTTIRIFVVLFSC